MISDITIDKIRQFIADRDWDQFHTPGALARSVSIEAGELLECFQWSDEPRDGNLEHVHEEIADVLIYCIMLSNKLGFDLDEIVLDKLHKNAEKYPVSTAKGSSAKQ
ncbi:nucleotide pyrophosphohydrolase [Bifidobacterium tsurumiense]|uniref:MazG nucleotide pyrophosphohydrolase n=1 Tax=Bifidobacterium tsurumiense TaxID=356829 RepID=A0A087EE02_9BIFI|nr:nucleotide pyrophosphohydrolase [Bifidobacterium tsurumiense]KFJ06003.1 MazG nucleotide pyrophosphohydrolase [Bifidobacterium tsurumiense]MDY4677826.1 nucleotide pyrophosphohydrolase [Bifidobacterium tsurumiense]MSS11866.1 nucleotide pyrophosphohydrolase [Bifidobacterium tsurumiense]